MVALHDALMVRGLFGMNESWLKVEAIGVRSDFLFRQLPCLYDLRPSTGSRDHLECSRPSYAVSILTPIDIPATKDKRSCAAQKTLAAIG